MFQHVVVPVDGSKASWRAVPIAARLAHAVDGKLDVITVVDRARYITESEAMLRFGLEQLPDLPVEPMIHVVSAAAPASAIAEHVDQLNGSLVVMSSHGHGRSASVLGSTADELLRQMFGPIVVIGPHTHADSGSVGGRYVVPLDGSDHSDMILPIVAAWTVEFGAEPWLVEAAGAGTRMTGPAASDFIESGTAAHRAREMSRDIGRDVEFDILHGGDPAHAIVDFASHMEASLIFACTHGRTGMSRLRTGSTAAHIVRHAPCPVVLYRPPLLTLD